MAEIVHKIMKKQSNGKPTGCLTDSRLLATPNTRGCSKYFMPAKLSSNKNQSKNKVSKMLTQFKTSINDIGLLCALQNKMHSSYEQKSAVFKSHEKNRKHNLRNKSMEVIMTSQQTQNTQKKEGLKLSFSMRTRKGLCSTQEDKPNQDSFIAHPNFQGSAHTHLFGVYDGHGSLAVNQGFNGHLISNFISSNLPSLVKEQVKLDGSEGVALHNAYRRMYEQLVDGPIDAWFSGSTALTCLIQKDRVFTANCGDSRALVGSMARKPKGAKMTCSVLSKDHKPSVSSEADRILSLGGRIEPSKLPSGKYFGPSRVWLPNEDVPGLAMSRAMGDMAATSIGVTWMPGTRSLIRTH